jgi:hypothetical protein
LSATSDCRIFFVIIRSEVASDCWSAVLVCALFMAELSGVVVGALLWSWQNAAIGSIVRQASAKHPWMGNFLTLRKNDLTFITSVVHHAVI